MSRPNFILIGAQKAGTTSMRFYLEQHPQVFMATAQECHYFNREEYFGDERWYAQWFVGAAQYHAVGEVTPDYDYYPAALKRIQQFDPDMKILYAVRDPVRRAISAYWMIRNYHHVDVPEIDIALSPGWALRYQPGLLERGHYSDVLDRIYRLFPKNQVLVYRLEDLRREPLKVLQRITNFIEVDAFRHVDLRKQRVGSYVMDTQVSERLADYYHKRNRFLEDKYGIYTGDWLHNS